jgi:hypothetical protein
VVADPPVVDDPAAVDDPCPCRNPDPDPGNRAAGTQAAAEDRKGRRKYRNRRAQNKTNLATRGRIRTDTHIPNRASQNLDRPSPNPNLGLSNPIRRASHYEILRTRGIRHENPCSTHH